jgi:hypothetical protein
MVVGEVRCRDSAGGTVERLADIEVRAVVSALTSASLITGPAEIAYFGRRSADAINHFPGGPANIADPQLAGGGMPRRAERVAQAVGDYPTRVRISAADEGIRRMGGSAFRIDPQHGAIEHDRAAGRPLPRLAA